MKKVFFLIAATFSIFFIQYCLSNLIEPRFVPNLLLLFVIFVDLYFGVRLGILAALMAGVLKDSFELSFLGGNVLIFLTAAYLAILFKKYLYVAGSRSSKAMLTFCVVLALFPIEFILQRVYTPINFGSAFLSVLIPQLIITSLIAAWFLNFLRQCASRLYV